MKKRVLPAILAAAAAVALGACGRPAARPGAAPADTAASAALSPAPEATVPAATASAPAETLTRPEQPLPERGEIGRGTLRDDRTGEEYSASTLILTPADGADEALAALLRARDLRVVYDRQTLGVVVVRTARPLSAAEMDALIAALEADPAVLSARRDTVVHPTGPAEEVAPAAEADGEARRRAWGVSAGGALTAGGTGMELTLRRAADGPAGALWTGAPFVLEKKAGGVWTEAERAVEGEFVWTCEAYLLPPGGALTFDVDWSGYYGAPEAGEYRLVKVLRSEQGEEIPVWVEFSVAG